MDIASRLRTVGTLIFIFHLDVFIQYFPDPSYFAGRCATIQYKGVDIGRIGILSPTVLEAFELSNPVSSVEITLEPFV